MLCKKDVLRSLQLTENMEMVIKRMVLKPLCNGERDIRGVKTEYYGLKSSKTTKKVRSHGVISM